MRRDVMRMTILIGLVLAVAATAAAQGSVTGSVRGTVTDPDGAGLPEHLSNSNVYMTVVRGMLSIGLDDQEIHEYEAGTLLKIPFQTKMNVKNLNEETLELIVVKAPAPKV